MCFGGDDGSDEAKRARQEEEKRQQKIREGTTRINNIFDGTTVGTGALGAGSAFDPNGTYYNADGTRWTPTTAPVGGRGSLGDALGGLDGQSLTRGRGMVRGDRGSRSDGSPLFDRIGRPVAGGSNTPEDQFKKLLAEGKLYSGSQNTGGFNDAFFKGRRDAYTSFATPQLEDQYGDAQKQLIFALDRSGNLDSSARGEKMSELQKLYDIQKQNVGDKALSYETQARTGVEDARANLIATLNATGDAEGAAKSALARSQALSAPVEYSPLSQVFTDFTNGLGVQAAQERSFAAGGPAPRYNTGLFGGSRGRVTVSS